MQTHDARPSQSRYFGIYSKKYYSTVVIIIIPLDLSELFSSVKMREIVLVALTIAYLLISMIRCENKTLGYKQDNSLKKIFEKIVSENSNVFQVKIREINFPPIGMVNGNFDK